MVIVSYFENGQNIVINDETKKTYNIRLSSDLLPIDVEEGDEGTLTIYDSQERIIVSVKDEHVFMRLPKINE